MKRKYCLVRTNGDLGVNSFVYVVWVGSSLRESATLALVEEFCKDVGWYFKRWSREVDSALELRCKLTRADGTRFVTPYQMISITIRQCYQTILDDSWIMLEQNRVMTPFEKFWRFRNNPVFLKAFNNQKRNTTCPPSKSKYLSHEKWSESTKVACCFALMILLIALDAIVTNTFITSTF